MQEQELLDLLKDMSLEEMDRIWNEAKSKGL